MQAHVFPQFVYLLLCVVQVDTNVSVLIPVPFRVLTFDGDFSVGNIVVLCLVPGSVVSLLHLSWVVEWECEGR